MISENGFVIYSCLFFQRNVLSNNGDDKWNENPLSHSILWAGFPLKNAEYRVTKKAFKDASVLDTPAPVPYPHQVIQAGLLCVFPN